MAYTTRKPSGRPRRHAGERFGAWTLMEKLDATTWLARCDCGVTREVQVSALVSGRSKGCLQCRTARKHACQ